MPFRLKTCQISYLHTWVRTAHRSSLEWQRNCVAERRGIQVDATVCQIYTLLVWNCFVRIPMLCALSKTIRPITRPCECDTIKKNIRNTLLYCDTYITAVFRIINTHSFRHVLLLTSLLMCTREK